MKKLFSGAVLGTVLLTSGCASIVSDSSYPVAINTVPVGAEFVITNDKGQQIHSGTTPSTVTLKSGDGFFSSASYTLSFSKDGYSQKQVEISSSMDGWYIGNIVFGGLIGLLIVDPMTGAMWKLPESHMTTLDQTVATAESKDLKVVTIDTIPEEERAKLEKIN